MIVNWEGRMWKEAVVVYFKALFLKGMRERTEDLRIVHVLSEIRTGRPPI
jgi:hypothetical protein